MVTESPSLKAQTVTKTTANVFASKHMPSSHSLSTDTLVQLMTVAWKSSIKNMNVEYALGQQ